MTGRVILITGASSGIGYAAAQELARKRAKLIMVCWNKEPNLTELVEEVRKASGNEEVYLQKVDLSKPKSVRKLAKIILEGENRLDVLINNAGGVSVNGSSKVHCGIGYCYATNFFGHFLLTNLLLPLLMQTPESRIINVTSDAHRRGELDLDNLDCQRPVSDLQVYCNAKLMMILFTNELSERLRHCHVTANSVHPGISLTSYLAEAWAHTPWLSRTVILNLIGLFFKSPAEAAQTVIYLATAQEVSGESGSYFVDCGHASPCQNSFPDDDDAIKRFWNLSVKLTDLDEG